jgi:hypothetical protein
VDDGSHLLSAAAPYSRTAATNNARQGIKCLIVARFVKNADSLLNAALSSLCRTICERISVVKREGTGRLITLCFEGLAYAHEHPSLPIL